MANVLHLSARADAPIACDMSTATDTPDQRLAEYSALFERALVRRERRAHGVVFAFRSTPGTLEQVGDLARRESACCPFLDYRVETNVDEVGFTLTNPVTGMSRRNVEVTLDTFYALPDHVGSDYASLLERLADGGVEIAEAGSDRWELRESAAG